jgi:dCMP deaminase
MTLKQSCSRPNWDTYFLQIAQLASSRATCARRKVGCVLVDSKKHIVSVGYNGVPSKFDHCIDEVPCEGVNAPSGTGLDACLAVHAEVNAFLHLTSQDILTAYLTVCPCISCTKMICNSNIKRVVAMEWYAHPEITDMLRTAGIELLVIRRVNASNGTDI